jgi:hypothetical protein
LALTVLFTIYTGNPDTCPTTAIGQGLKFAGNEFGNKDTFRQEALWVVILLTDGAANAPTLACPNNTWTNPYCRDLSPTSRHCLQDDNESCLAAGGVYWPERYDADDYARDMADFVAEDQNALIFTIGLGDLVRTSVPRLRINDPTQKCTEVPYDPVEDCYGAGEQLMRYAAECWRRKILLCAQREPTARDLPGYCPIFGHPPDAIRVLRIS